METIYDVQDKEFTQIYDAYYERIYSFVYFKTLHREVAEDITSMTFLKAYEKIHQFDATKGNFSSWIYTIAANTIRDHFRTTHHATSLDDVWDLSSDEDIAIDVGNRVLVQEVLEHMRTLSAQQRDVLMLRLWEGRSHKEIAEILGISEATSKMTLSRSLSSLRQKMPLTAFITLLTHFL
jgi:RNA polymerase sigma-70 factor (ECF subfamily)